MLASSSSLNYISLSLFQIELLMLIQEARYVTDEEQKLNEHLKNKQYPMALLKTQIQHFLDCIFAMPQNWTKDWSIKLKRG